MDQIQSGLVGESSEIVTDELTAASYDSGLVSAFATPAMVGLMESAAFLATKEYLPEGQTTVGVEVNIRHLAATPVGMQVHARAELVRVDGRRLFFAVEAWDEVEKIGEGTHTRMLVDEARFNARFEEKRSKVNRV